MKYGRTEQMNHGIGDALLFAAGAVFGAAATLLFAPQTGMRTRRQIARAYEDAKDQAADLCGNVSDGVKSLRRTVARQIDAGKDVVAKAHDGVLASLPGVKKGIGGLAERLRRN